jgi:hypothetical protein
MAVTFSASGSPTAGGVQQTYALEHDALLEGQLSDIRNNTIITRVNETAVVIPFGNGVVYDSTGTGGLGAKTLSASGDTFLGVSVLTYVDETAVDANSRPGVKVDQAMNVASEGAVAVYVHGAVNPSTVVRVIHTATGVKYAGRFNNAAIAGKTAVLSNARYLTTTTGDGVAILELNGPSFTLTGDS